MLPELLFVPFTVIAPFWEAEVLVESTVNVTPYFVSVPLK
jgi:hypothetical protein